MAILFISDLHLDPQRPKISRLCLEFLRGPATRAQALYILGDLFEYWLGDDMVDEPDFADIIAGLRRLTTAGVPVGVMHGNRDFLLGETFAQRTGCTLLDEVEVIDLFGVPTLLMHGDSLCTDDVDHQAWRRQVLNPAWQREVLTYSLQRRRAMALEMRRESEAHKRGKTMSIMDVNQDAVEATMRRHRVARLIHGHTHRPGRHTFSLDGVPAERYVLGDWYTQGSILVATPSGLTLEILPVAPARQDAV